MTTPTLESVRRGPRTAAILVAFCGIDGAGKTTLIRELMRSGAVSSALSLRKRAAPNASLVRQAMVGSETAQTKFASSPLGPLLGLSYALDFRAYFSEVVAPELEERRLILLDRWRPCVVAVADMCGTDRSVVHDIIRPIPDADLTIFVRLDPAEARQRIERRGEPAFDEDIATLRALEASYERTLIHQRGPMVEVVNHDLESTTASLRILIGALGASQSDPTHRGVDLARARPPYPTESVA